LRSTAVEQGSAFGKAKWSEAQPIGAERIGFDDVCAGRDVLAVDRADELRTRLHEGVE
jgi:hypothetical protein